MQCFPFLLLKGQNLGLFATFCNTKKLNILLFYNIITFKKMVQLFHGIFHYDTILCGGTGLFHSICIMSSEIKYGNMYSNSIYVTGKNEKCCNYCYYNCCKSVVLDK